MRTLIILIALVLLPFQITVRAGDTRHWFKECTNLNRVQYDFVTKESPGYPEYALLQKAIKQDDNKLDSIITLLNYIINANANKKVDTVWADTCMQGSINWYQFDLALDKAIDSVFYSNYFQRNCFPSQVENCTLGPIMYLPKPQYRRMTTAERRYQAEVSIKEACLELWGE